MQANQNKQLGWKFVGDQGEFVLDQPQHTSYLYLPLANDAGMMSAITPDLHGDMKTSNYTFLMPPVSAEDLHNSKASRNFWVYIEGKGAWSASGVSAKQTAQQFDGHEDQVKLAAGFLWHKVTRESQVYGLKSEIVSFVPTDSEQVELMKVTITNTSEEPIRITPTAAIPLYGRAADEIRDHRHVTSLLHRIYTSTYGIELQPSLSFDERGHRINKVSYNVLGSEGNGTKPVGFFPISETYVGEGGSLDWPESIVKNLAPSTVAGEALEGYEAVGAIRFEDAQLVPGESRTYIVAMSIAEDRIDTEQLVAKYVSSDKFDQHLETSKAFWENKLDKVILHSGDKNFDYWMKWVTLQPILRRMYGCSFMPHHDYGRGGRGWRDLWQDCLGLLMMEPAEVRSLLLNNFAGVRIDGSNATIIGNKPGEFLADRNNIPRVWMDHGAWPFLTTLFYLNQSGDLDFLLQEQSYFKDIHIKRCKDKDASWTAEDGFKLKTDDGEVYQGTILEHLLLQNLVPFFHVGEHNNIKLEGADWNDGLDLGSVKGESVAFTAFYASNLLEISKLLLQMKRKMNLQRIELTEGITILFDSLTNSINYDSVSEKQALLDRYYNTCTGTITSNKASLDIDQVAADLEKKANWIMEHLRSQEWIKNSEGYEWFNGYYNNDGEAVEGDHESGVRMTLTGQVFTIMGGAATDSQVKQVSTAVDKYLKDPEIGYRLNSNFGGIQQNLGRAFGFAFGHKENGAMFSHMTVMYGNALYKRGFVKEGHDVLSSIYKLCANFDRSRIYPGVPEYINAQGRGMYHYLTGSASWLLLSLVTEVFGVKGLLGDLTLEPKLVQEQYEDNHEASIVALFADRKLIVNYVNKNLTPYGQYEVQSVSINGESIPVQMLDQAVVIDRARILGLPEDKVNEIEVIYK